MACYASVCLNFHISVIISNVPKCLRLRNVLLAHGTNISAHALIHYTAIELDLGLASNQSSWL